MRRRLTRSATVLLVVAGMSLAAAPAWAHPHTVDTPAGEVELANGQLHDTTFDEGKSCGGDPAAYGLESAHHGPDSGEPGNADGCYQSDDTEGPPNEDDENPAIG